MMVKSIALDFRPLGSAIFGDDGMMYVVTFIISVTFFLF
jgi:hypothetical protein